MDDPAAIRPRSKTRRWQFSLVTLLIAMTWMGLVCVSLRSPTELWAGVVFILLAAALLTAALIAIYRDGRTRAFAVGFLVFALSYAWISERYAPEPIFNIRSRLPTTNWAVELFSLLHGDAMQTQTRSIAAPVIAYTAAPASYPITPVVAQPPALPAPPALNPAVAPYIPSTPQPPTRVVTTTFVPGGTVSLSAFLEVAHRSLALLLGVIGGIVAQLLYSTRRDEPSTPQHPS